MIQEQCPKCKKFSQCWALESYCPHCGTREVGRLPWRYVILPAVLVVLLLVLGFR